MKKIKFFAVFAVLWFLYPINISALCDVFETNSERVMLRNLAANVTFSSIDRETSDKMMFDIRINNLHHYIVVRDRKYDKEAAYSQDIRETREITLSGYEQNQTVIFDIYSVDSKCVNDREVILTTYVVLPSYNKYYKDSLCEGISNFPLCQKWINVDMSREEFQRRVNEYKRSLIPEEEEEEKFFQIINSLFDFIIKNYPYILITIIVVGSGVIINERRKEFKL